MLNQNTLATDKHGFTQINRLRRIPFRGAHTPACSRRQLAGDSSFRQAADNTNESSREGGTPLPSPETGALPNLKRAEEHAVSVQIRVYPWLKRIASARRNDQHARARVFSNPDARRAGGISRGRNHRCNGVTF